MYLDLGPKEEFFKRSDWSLSDSESVRVNFRLTELATFKLKDLSKKYRVTYKELFDNMFQKLDSEYHMETSGDKEKSELLDNLGGWIEMDHTEYNEEGQAKVVRKTYVISRGALRVINNLTNYYKVSRDKMVSDAIDWFTLYYQETLEMIEAEKAREEALSLISDLHSQMLNVRKKLSEILGDSAIVIKIFGDIEEEMSDLIKDFRALPWLTVKGLDSKPL
jgi:alpha-amylase/alpha-mannosidase (GH57 family)